MMRRLILKLQRRWTLHRDLAAELEFHREMAKAAGNPIPLGNETFLKEQAFDSWRFNSLENLWRDLVYGWRSLRKSPGLAAAALLSLGLGIGVSTAIFSLAVEFLLSEPSVRDAGQVVYVRQGGNSHMQPAVVELLRRSGVFEDVAGENEESYVNFDDGRETRRIFSLQGTMNFFTALGVPVSPGRGWTENDPREVVVLHPHFWRTRLAADPAIVGKSILLDGRPYTVLGILPDHYRSLIGYGYTPDVLMPSYQEDTILQAYGRLKSGMTVDQLNAALPAVSARVREVYPERNPQDVALNAKPAAGFARLQREKEALGLALFFALLLGLVNMVLLIACVNVAGLLLARASVRRQEISIRLAIGASRGRLLQQLMAESLLLSMAGTALGFLLALAVTRAAAVIPLPVPVPIRLHIEPDWRVACYAALLAIVSTLACGLVPAWQAVRDSFAEGLRRERRMRLRRTLVVAQVALSFVVLVAAALFLQNLLRSSSMGPGFDLQHTVRAEVYLPPGVYKSAKTINPYVDRVLREASALPGIEAAAAARLIPFTDATTFGTDMQIAGRTGKQQARFNWNAVSAEYFRAMDIPVVRGRAFRPDDNGSRSVAIVNEEFARRYLAGMEAVGARLTMSEGQQYEVVGVVRGTKNMTIGEDPRAQMYEPLAQIRNVRPKIQFVLRSALPPATQLAAVRNAIRRVEPGAGLEVETMFSAVGFAFLPSRVGAVLMGSIGALGLLLAVIGLYGVLAFSVTSRTREIGIRMAIGASPTKISRLVLSEFARLMGMGIAIGLMLALLVTRPLAMFLVQGLSPADPASFVGVITALTLTGVAAALGPARRALTIDPARCLKSD